MNLERRRGDFDKCAQLYEGYIASAKSKAVASALAIKFARFLFHVRHDAPGARAVLDAAVARDPLNQRLHTQRLDLALHTPGTPYAELDGRTLHINALGTMNRQATLLLVRDVRKHPNSEPEAITVTPRLMSCRNSAEIVLHVQT